jgi:hypothetical protein
MLILFAPLLTIIALAVGGISSVVATLLNMPRRFRRIAQGPMVELPSVPWPQAAAEIAQQVAAPTHRAPTSAAN